MKRKPTYYERYESYYNNREYDSIEESASEMMETKEWNELIKYTTKIKAKRKNRKKGSN